MDIKRFAALQTLSLNKIHFRGRECEAKEIRIKGTSARDEVILKDIKVY